MINTQVNDYPLYEVGQLIIGSLSTETYEGKSAYQVAVSNGFKGTESEWLMSLVGTQGPAGPQGATGPQGAKGEDGSIAFEELTPEQKEQLRGPQGLTGAIGPAGPVGPQGPKGEIGPQGVPGPQGAKGAQGPTGAIGPQGPAGAKGATGNTGAPGATGAKGATGTSLRMKGAWSSTVAYVCDASYIDMVTSDGNTYRCKSNNTNQVVTNTTYWELVAQKGSTGDRGATGAVGPQGPVGPTGAKGEKGDKGEDGTMSFEDLTPEQKESLKGDQGPQGPRGEAGPTGPQGIQGPVGPKGDVGPRGEQGAIGAQGPVGAAAAIKWQGEWKASESYVKDDAVLFNGSSFVCVSSCSGVEPSFSEAMNNYTNTTPDRTYKLRLSAALGSDLHPWKVMAVRGAKGEQGIQGEVDYSLVYTKNEIDNMIGSIGSVLDRINGEEV